MACSDRHFIKISKNFDKTVVKINGGHIWNILLIDHKSKDIYCFFQQKGFFLNRKQVTSAFYSGQQLWNEYFIEIFHATVDKI